MIRAALPTFFHQVAAAGNAVMLCVVVLLAALGPWLIGDAAPQLATSLPPPAAGPRAERVVLVVLDALRLDAARDERRMPNLHAAASYGGWGVARVESAVPSTIAGITTFVTGRVPGPASFLLDFGAPTAPHGGLLQLLHEHGRRTFVAGPRLWRDRYGPWIDASHLTRRIGDDEAILQAGLSAIADRSNDLVIIHLSQGDEVAHVFGGASLRYANFVAAADRAVAQVLAQLPAGTAVVFASDHGVTDNGGHAGPEPAVLNTPLVLYGPGLPSGEFGTVSQAALPALIAGALQLPWSPPAAAPAAAPGRWLPWAMAPPAVGLTWLVLGALPSRSRHRKSAVLNNLLWPALVLLGIGQFTLAAAVALLALAWFARGQRLRHVDPAVVVVVLSGALFGLARWAVALAGDGVPGTFVTPQNGFLFGLLGALVLLATAMRLRSAARSVERGEGAGPQAAGGTREGRRSSRSWPRVTDLVALATPSAAYVLAGPRLAGTCGLGIALGLVMTWLARRRPRLVAIATVVVAPLLAGVAGQGLSLSTIDVRMAFPLLDTFAGPVAALLVVVAAQVLPIVSYACLVSPRGCASAGRSRSGAFAGALGAVFVGQVLVATALLVGYNDPVGRSLAVALFVRATVDLMLIAIVIALASVRAGGRTSEVTGHSG